MDIRLASVFARELWLGAPGDRDFAGLQAMSVSSQVNAMCGGGRSDGRTAAGYLFHSGQISAFISAGQVIVDLGCGTGEQLLQIAEINPATRFVGVDREQSMLEAAAARAVERRLTNVEFLCGEVTDLRALPAHSFDGVISTMTLHHLPGIESVGACFDEISRILRPGGAVYIEDFGRLKSEKSIEYFVRRADEGVPDAFSQLYQCSLRAAFEGRELRELARSHLPAAVHFFCTVPIPFLIVLATPPRNRLSESQRAGLLRLYESLDARRRKDYHELCLAFRLGGLRDALDSN